MARLRAVVLSLVSLLLAVSICRSEAANRVNGTVYYLADSPGYYLALGVVDKENGTAYGYYEASENETGWGVLNIAAGYASGRKFEDQNVMMAAGILEGALTHKQLYLLYLNLYDVWFSKMSTDDITKVKNFYVEQRTWMEGMIKTYSNTSDTWYYVGLIYSQWQGLLLGYDAESSTPLDEFAFDMLCGQGDLLDIMNFIFKDQRPDSSTITRDEYQKLLMRDGHCSALVKVLPGFENVFASHSSWFTYSAMNRIYKHYAFRTSRGSPATEVMSFSSYPGFLSSLDDFYIMDSGLVMLQTTNSVLNKTLYDQATSQALLAWHRVRLANWLARGGKEWAGYITEYNTGTYNNQYMVLDLKQVELKKGIHDNALWVVEQIPGYVGSGDQSAILRAGYWPSYNIPFYEYVYNISGYPEAVARVGSDASYQLAPRAKIFRRDQGNVTDMQSMEYIMRFNDYKNDPYSEGDPAKSICARGDLSSDPDAGGCYDTKVTDYFMAGSMTALTENGPTHQGLPPFDWQASKLGDPHLGQPNLFDFTFVKMAPIVP